MSNVPRLDAIKARCEKATNGGGWRVQEEENPLNALGCRDFPDGIKNMQPARWIVTERDHPQLQGPDAIISIGISPYREHSPSLVIGEADADFIAHSRSDIPWLVQEVERLREYARCRNACARTRAMRTTGVEHGPHYCTCGFMGAPSPEQDQETR